MDRRQKKRLLIFLLVPILAVILFITDDLVIRLITLALIVVYVAFIIFLRDSIRFDGKYAISEDDDLQDDYDPAPAESDYGDSFEIISKPRKDIDVITDENYSPEYHVSKTDLKPPDLKERFEEIANESLPQEIGHDGQFAFVLEKILTVIKDAYDANTAIFFWYNKKKEKLSVEKFVSNSDHVSKRKFDIEDDILSKIVQRAEPELLSDISPAAEADAIRYYESPQGIRSFIGVPLFFENQLIAILAADAKVDDAFGIETIYSFGRFVRVITMVIQIFEEKHSDTVANQRLQGLLNLLNPEVDFDDEAQLMRSLEDSSASLVPWDAYVFVYFNPVNQKFETKKVKNKTSLKYIGEGLSIDVSGTLVGKAIVNGIPVKIDDTSTSGYIRFSKAEDVSFDGSFLAVPLVYKDQNYGVLCFESLKKNAYTNQDIKFLKSSLNFISYIVYSHSSQTLLKSLLATDMETRALNEDTFKNRLSEDLYKANQLNVPGAVALIKIDDFLEQDSLFDGDPFPKVLKSIASTIKSELTPLNIFGRLDEKLFAVSFFNTSSKNVFIWAEKLRVKIARQPVAVVSKQSTFTVSIGVASFSASGNVDEILHNADLALHKALEKGGNAVRNIN